jgi:DNA-binding NarL/FixJ family response regulator
VSALNNEIAVSIVEDDIPLRTIYAEWIEQAEGFKLVSLYEDGQKAFEGIPEDNPDVVLSDINLPGLNGVECVRGLKKQLPKMQFVMITVYEDSNRIFKALEAGATGYLLKQTPREQLLESLREVYDGGSPMSSGIARKVVQCFRKSPPASKENELSQLSKREEEVLNLLAQGYLCKEISDTLGISTHTVDTYRRRIYEKLHVHSRAQATALYNQLKPVCVSEPGN